MFFFYLFFYFLKLLKKSSYTEQLFTIGYEGYLNDKQYFSLMSDLVFEYTDLIPKLVSEFKLKFGREIPEIESLIPKYKAVEKELIFHFGILRGKEIVDSKLPFNFNKGYPKNVKADENEISKLFIAFFNFLGKLSTTIIVFLKPIYVKRLLVPIIEMVAKGFLGGNLKI